MRSKAWRLHPGSRRAPSAGARTAQRAQSNMTNAAAERAAARGPGRKRQRQREERRGARAAHAQLGKGPT
eukprot:5937005-Pyramimonas_sp.AAC.1